MKHRNPAVPEPLTPENMNEKNSPIQKKISRRDFVKASALTAGGLLSGALPLSAGAYVAGSDTLKIALVGCGARGTGAAFNALNSSDGVKLVAMADVLEDRLNDSYDLLSRRFGDTGKLDVPEDQKFVGFDSYKQAIELADVVLLTTPTFFRPLHFEEAVRKGKHVFMEKPVAVDPAGVRSILESGKMAREKGLNVVVGLQRRYAKSYREMYRRLQNGDIGDIISGQVYWNQGIFDVRLRKPEYSELEYQIRNWYYFIWLSGDQVLDQLIHNLDVANWYIGEYPVSAHGMGGREVRNDKIYGQIFDHHAIEYTYPSGLVLSAQCRQIPGCHNRVAEQFQGTSGSLRDNTIRDRQNNVKFQYDGRDDPSPYDHEHTELFASIKKGDVIDNTEYGAKSSMTAIMGFMATYSGQLIRWDEALNSPKRLVPDHIDWDSVPPVLPDEHGNYPVPVPGVTEVM